MDWIKVIDKYESYIHMWIWRIDRRYTCWCFFSSLGNDGTKFYFSTNENAPQYKIVTIDISDPKFERKELVPEDKGAKLESVEFANENYLALVYKRNASEPLYHQASSCPSRSWPIYL